MSKAILSSGNKNDIAFKIKHVSNSKQRGKNNIVIISLVIYQCKVFNNINIFKIN